MEFLELEQPILGTTGQSGIGQESQSSYIDSSSILNASVAQSGQSSLPKLEPELVPIDASQLFSDSTLFKASDGFSPQFFVTAEPFLVLPGTDSLTGLTLMTSSGLGDSGHANGGITLSASPNSEIRSQPLNQAPTSLRLSPASIAENVLAQSIVSTLSTTDPNRGDTFTYRLVTGAGATDNSTFSITGNQLKINASPDFETKSSYSIRVGTTDQGGLSFEKDLTVSIRNVNEAPTDLALSNSVISGNVAPGTVVGDFSTSDPDAKGRFTYSLVSGAGAIDNALFKIVDGQLKIKTSLGLDSKSSYSIRVRTTDQGGLSFDKVFTIAITDVNEAPTQILLAGSTIAENSAQGTFIGELTTQDPDEGDTHAYQLLDDAGGRFQLVGTQLQVKNGALLDFESNPQFSIEVQSTDAGGLITTQRFAINVSDVNEAPTLSAISDLTITEGSLVSFSAVATDPDQPSQPLTYSLESAPIAGVSLDSATSLFTWTPTEAQGRGSYIFTIKVSDGALNDTKTFNIQVISSNEAPVIQSLPKTEVVAGVPYRYEVKATDADNDALTYRFLASPDGMTINAQTGVIEWQDTAGNIGSQSITVEVSDGRGGADLQTYTLTVLGEVPNRPPNFTTVPIVDGNVNVPYIYDADAVDPDGDSLRYTFVSAPDGVVFDEATGKLLWTPTASQIGTQSVVLRIEDGNGGTATQEFKVLVQQTPGNHVPVIVSDPIKVINLIPSVSTPKPGDPIILNTTVRDFSASRPDFEDTGPFGVSSTPGIVEDQLGFDGKPVFKNGFGAFTEENFNQWYNDVSGVNLSKFVPLELNETAPGSGIYEFSSSSYFPIDDQLLGNEGFSNNYHFTTEIHAAFTYKGGEFLYFSGDDDVWVYINGQLVIDIGGIHPESAGSVSLDSLGLTVGNSYSIDIFHAERQRGASNFRLQTSLGLRENIFEAYTYDVKAVDPDQDVLTYSLVEAPLSMTINSVSGLIEWKPIRLVSSAQLPVRVRVDDGRGGFDIQEYMIQVPDTLLGEIRGIKFLDLNGNGSKDFRTDATSVALIDNVYNSSFGYYNDQLGDLYPGNPSDPLAEYFRGPDVSTGDPSLRFSTEPDLSQINPLGNWLSDPQGAILNGFWTDIQQIPSRWSTNTESAIVYEIDGGEFGISNVKGSFGVDNGIFIWINGQYKFGALDGGSASPNEYQIDIGDLPPGKNYVQILREDHGQGTDFYVIITGTKNQSNEDGLSGINVYLDLNANGVLEPNEPRQTTASDNPDTPDIDETGQYRFTGLLPGDYIVREVVPQGYTQTSPNHGFYTVSLEAGGVVEGIDFGNQVAVETVVNAAPIFTTTAPTITEVGKLLRYNAAATDSNADVLIYDLPVKPVGMAVDSSSGVLVWQPTLNQANQTYNVVLRVRDGRGGVDLQAFQITVPALNTAPTITSTPPGTSVAGLPYQYRVLAQDADNDVLAFQLLNSPDGATINPSTGVINFTPTSAQIGNQSFTLLVSDRNGGETTQTFTLAVVADAPNDAPVILSTPRNITQLNRTYLYQVNAFDHNGDPLTFSLTTAPDGLTVDESGLMVWTPTAQQFGSNEISLQVADERGGTATQTFTVNVVSQGVNQAPEIVSTPPLGATANREYRYAAIATDPDGDVIRWGLDAAPTGMSVDPLTGTVRWLPTLEQLGSYTITLRALDSSGGFATQTFEVNVRGINTPPAITSIPKTQAAVDTAYTYTPIVTDIDSDPISFSLLGAPDGMTINADTGLIEWTPNSSQLGIQTVDILASDGQGGVATQTFSISVFSTVPNSPPVIDSLPKFVAVAGAPYAYATKASDPDGDALTFSLLDAPSGMTIDPATGVIQWTPNTSQLGTTMVKVAVTDPSGGLGSQSFSLLVRDNNAPTITSTPVTTGTAGGSYRYDVRATDPNADSLSFSLINGPQGMTLDQLGRLQWSPSVGDTGKLFAVEVAVTDPYGATATQTYNLTVEADIKAPLVNLFLTKDRVDIGESVTVQVKATDSVGVETLTLRVNGAPVTLDAQGRATLSIASVGAVNLQATATDAAGNTGTADAQVFGIDPFNTEAPVVSFSNLVEGSIFTAPGDIIGTVTDDNLLSYSLSIAPVEGGDFVEIARGTNSVTDGILGTFDPSTLQNDSYILRLSATDLSGLTSFVETQVSVSGDLKLGNFRLSFTDLTIPVTGIPIQVTRTYDSLTSATTDDFGYGWRMEFRDTDLRTSLGRDAELEEIGIASKGFKAGDKVFITLPGGQREVFTFKPTLNPISRYFPTPGSELYRPAFESDNGVTSTLTVKNVDLVQLEDGEFASLNGGRYNPENGEFGFGGYYELTTKEGIVYRIDGLTGDLDTIADRSGNTLTFTDFSVTSSTGQKVTFERDAQNRITAVIDPDGNRVTYQYNASGDLISVTDREGDTTRFEYSAARPHYLEEVIDPLGRSGVRTEYDAQGRLTRMIDADGNPVDLIYDPANDVQQVRDQLGNVTTYVYDERGNVLTERDANGSITTRTYDADNNTLTETDPLGNKMTFTYDADNNVLSETDALGNVTRYTYDANGSVLTTTDPTGQTITNTYDAKGNLTKIEGQRSGPITLSYDAFGNLTSMQDGSGTTTFEYDRFGNISRQTDALGKVSLYTYDGSGNRTSETTTQTLANGTTRTLVTQMEYDAENRLVKVTDAEGGISRTIYDAVGNRVEEIDALGRSTKYLYDERGQLIATLYPDSTPNDDTDNPRTRTVYDAKGQVISEIDELGRVTRMVYDALGRQIATIYPDSTPNDDTDNPRTRMEYDAAGRMIAQIDERGNRTTFFYDKAGRVIETILPDETAAISTDNPRFTTSYDAAGRQLTQTDALGQVTQFLYDDLGRPVGQVYADGSRTSVEFDNSGRVVARTDQAGVKTRYEYDALGRLKAVVDALGQRTVYAYNEQGNLLTQTDANGNVTRYEYDRLGRRVATVLPLGEQSTFEYDAVGRLIKTTDFNSDVTTYRYDERDRLVFKDLPGTEFDETHTYKANGLKETVIDGRGTTAYSYDERNRLSQRIDPDGRTIAYSYDVAGNRTTVEIPSGTTAYTFDAQNRLKSVTDPEGGVTTYTYNPVGNLELTQFPNGTVETREYDNLNRLFYIETRGPSGIIVSYRYTLDKTGNRTAVVEQDGRRVEYSYDTLYRLTQETIYDPGATAPSRTIAYIYDAVGNRLSRNDSGEGSTLYTYDDNDRLLTSTLNGTVTTYTYDNNGNTTSKATDGTTITYQWNADNRLISADTNGDGAIDVVNRYDENGIRVSQTVNGEETRFLIDANRDYAQVLEEYTSSGVIRVSYVYGNDLISQNRGGEQSFYHVDGLGSTMALSDQIGLIIDKYVYDSFGLTFRKNGDINNLYLFAGEQADLNTGLDYLRARYFNKSNGRFISRDTFEGFSKQPITLNKYLYGNTNPINFVDPSGNITIGDAIGTVALLAVLSGLAFGARKVINSIESGIYVVGHPVIGNGLSSPRHLSVRIIPENFIKWAAIAKKSFDGEFIITLGAGSEDGKLVSDINRYLDVEKEKTDSEKIELATDNNIWRLILADLSYGDNLDYDLFPAVGGITAFNNGYNSNSYIASLLSKVGFLLPSFANSATFPGVQKLAPW
jgi:fibro-slime domain-containing protein/RHS repeat-associated protein